MQVAEDRNRTPAPLADTDTHTRLMTFLFGGILPDCDDKEDKGSATPFISSLAESPKSIPVHRRLVWPILVQVQVVCLLLGQFGEFDAQLFDVQSRHFFVQVLR
ncbi:hypothetical protein SAMN05216428_10871 [Nitrosospira sp. Nsp11]|nr:hypothetical protein SAMN05216428_10871 [Nitrosospira sp. Nsp11]